MVIYERGRLGALKEREQFHGVDFLDAVLRITYSALAFLFP